MRRFRPTAIMAIIGALAALLLGAAPANASSACASVIAGWGSGDKTGSGATSAELTGARIGDDGCFDRFVLDFAPGALPATYHVGYASEVYTEGQDLPMSSHTPHGTGGLIAVHLQEQASPSLTYSVLGPMVPTANRLGIWSATWGGAFEGHITSAVGARARLPLRVFTLSSPNRLVIDVGHSWR
ncbi:MAG TPA: hypothetical protein VLI05_02535 [Candidatus Saccharimonadia bacterium]|nr:hypothetical protein [Candidatus Saccharimonadia bacterium]